MAVLTISQINNIWSNRLAIRGYTYVCDDGMLYRGNSDGTLLRLNNVNQDTWLRYKKLNQNDSLTAVSSNNTQSSGSSNTAQSNSIVITTQETGNNSELTYDDNGNLIKKTLS